VKNDTILLIGAGVAAYFLLRKKDEATTSGGDSFAGSTPLGFTSADVTALKDAGLNNAQVVTAALNQPP